MLVLSVFVRNYLYLFLLLNGVFDNRYTSSCEQYHVLTDVYLVKSSEAVVGGLVK
jgi:hypothetical protein